MKNVRLLFLLSGLCLCLLPPLMQRFASVEPEDGPADELMLPPPSRPDSLSS